MNVFEDLIEELKEENLLEETVIESFQEKQRTDFFETVQPKNKDFSTNVGNQTETNGFYAGNGSVTTAETVEANIPPPNETSLVTEELYINRDFELPEDDETIAEPSHITQDDLSDLLSNAAQEFDFALSTPKKSDPPKAPPTRVNEKEYYRKRAMEEVTGLQMVEHVLSGVEREQMKLVPKPYDDLTVKKALHSFMQVSEDFNLPEHAQAEFQLMQETESWYSALSHRDKHITVAHLRRFCETTRPALSPQALIALARFYRNSPYSEQVRSKFDLVVSRLFTKEIGDEERELLFNNEELIQQIKELYADWASIQVYSVEDDDSNILITTLKFQDFITEVEDTGNFEDLIKTDFFNRLRMFKEGCQENFFAPLVLAAAVECNVRVGNRYVKLIEKERENSNAGLLEEKYGFLHDQSISDATGKTLQLAELLRERGAQSSAPAEIVEVSVKNQSYTPYQPLPKKAKRGFLGVNKWLLAATVIAIIGSVGLYSWAEMKTQEIKSPVNVQKVNLENSILKDYFQTARITDETFFGVTSTNWENLNLEKKEEILGKVLAIGSEKGYKQVHLISGEGKTVGYATSEKLEVYSQ